MDSGLRGTRFPFLVSGTWIPDSNRYWILDSLSGIPESKPQDSGFHNQKFPGFRITLHWVTYLLSRGQTFEQLGLLN